MISKNSGSQGQPQLHRQISTDSTVAEFTHITNGSISSLNSYASKDKQENKAFEESIKGQKLVEEEVSSTGKVNH